MLRASFEIRPYASRAQSQPWPTTVPLLPPPTYLSYSREATNIYIVQSKGYQIYRTVERLQMVFSTGFYSLGDVYLLVVEAASLC